MRHPYFRRRPAEIHRPRGVRIAVLEEVEGVAHRPRMSPARILVATITAFTARSIADALRRFIMPLGRVDQLIASGGGARNPALLRMIHGYLPEVEVLTAKAVGVDGDTVEVVAFAILAIRCCAAARATFRASPAPPAPAILGKLTLPPKPRS